MTTKNSDPSSSNKSKPNNTSMRLMEHHLPNLNQKNADENQKGVS